MHGTNAGLIIYDKNGNYVRGVPQKEFNDGIDPKMAFDLHNRVFLFDLWWHYDPPKTKPVNISVSETSDPRGAWNTYPVPAPNGVDGGGIGYSRTFIGYSFPGGAERTFVLKTAEAKAGKPVTVWHFSGSLDHPVFVQDPIDDLFFVELTETEIVLTRGRFKTATCGSRTSSRSRGARRCNGTSSASTARGSRAGGSPTRPTAISRRRSV